MQRLFRKLFNTEQDFRLILFNIISVVGLIGGAFSLSVSIANGLPFVQDIIVVIALAVLVVCIYLANEKKMLRQSSVIIIVLITFFLLPVMFFTGGGVYGGMSSWFLLGMVFTFLLIEGKLCWILVALQTVLYVGCYVTAYYYPRTVMKFPNEKGVFIDVVQSMLIAVFTIGMIIKFQNRAYDKQLAQTAEHNRRLAEAKDMANKANAAKTEFLSHMSHDIRTPINGILGMLDIAEETPQDPEKQADCLRKIRISSNHLLSLINDILDISMLESGKVAFSEEAFDLLELIKSCEIIVHERADEKHVSILTQGEAEHTWVMGSPLHVRQIIINILGNAIKYNKEYGRVDIELKELEYDERDNKALMQIKISDTGRGMSEEFQTSIFEAFTQENASARTQFMGSGLGMAITKELVDQMKGSVKVVSKLGEGSVFTVVLPFRTAGGRKAAQDETDEQPSIAGMHILLAEDNDLNREIAEHMLNKYGASVTSALNGKEALDIVKDEKQGTFDCILMDIMMPEMDGLETTHEIRSLEGKDISSVPIIAMSANAYTEDVEKAKTAGMNDYLTKPFDVEKMLRIIAAYR